MALQGGSGSDVCCVHARCLAPEVLVPVLDTHRGESGALLHGHLVLLCSCDA
jgi:hypothetical protein